MTLTDIIALLAFFVALYGAILSTILYCDELLHIKLICLSNNYFSFTKKEQVCDDEGFIYWSYNENLYSLAIHIQIRNNSKSNTTINCFTLNDSYILDSSTDIDKQFAAGFYKANSNIFDNSLQTLNILKPLISLNSYETVEGYLVFDNLVETPSSLNITVDTVQKSKKFKLKVNVTDCRKNL